MLFQSIAGTQKCNEEFGITAALLDEALEMVTKMGGAPGPNLMYFETGQGSELSLRPVHHGVDMSKPWRPAPTPSGGGNPFMVNNVTGFIGPETHFDGKQIIRGSLEDHFMGKLLGSADGHGAVLHQPHPTTRPDKEKRRHAAGPGRRPLLHGRPAERQTACWLTRTPRTTTTPRCVNS